MKQLESIAPSNRSFVWKQS